MTWPPLQGDPLPRAARAHGVREKLLAYSLRLDHERGGPKARGFERILGITVEDVDYLEAAICAGVLIGRISIVRDNSPHGVNCVVDIVVRGRGEKRDRSATVRTVWELRDRSAAPRLVSTFARS